MIDISEKTILITGGTGSFGKKMVERLIRENCKKIIVFSRDEFKQDIMRNDFKDAADIEYVLGDVRDFDSVNEALRGVDYVFHAAALKQVPSCEFYPTEAVKTNIIGSDNVIKASIKNNVSKVVCLSTDKAVYPINAMGMSKAMMEKIAQAQARRQHSTIVSCVRYGNVMYSRGSVIPLFINQILVGKKVTITNPNMTRFLLSLEEAISLVLTAFEHAQQGEIYVRKAPAADISTLADALSQILNRPIEKLIVGERHSEKLFEVLVSAEEMHRANDLGEYIKVSADLRNLNYNEREVEANNSALEDYTSHNTKRLDILATRELLMTIPEIKNILL